MLTKLEDQILLTAWKLRGQAYGVNVFQELQKINDIKVAVGVVYFALDRMTKRGLLQTYMGEPTAVRGGMRKKYYEITQQGIKELAKSMKVLEKVWEDYHGLTTATN